MKIAIYINNLNICEVDCSDLTKGNPGIGGTEYCIFLLAQVYKGAYPNDEVVLCANKNNGMLPKVDKIIEVGNILSLPSIIADISPDILLISAVDSGKPLSNSLLEELRNRKIKTITWGHNFYLSDFCVRISNNPYIAANVFVGHQQYDRYIDHKVIHKSTYIYNMYPCVDDVMRKSNDGKTVAYIGSLVPTKGFHLLANAWKNVLKEVPDAQLHVVGSGKLYDRNSKLGEYGIAEESYESTFIKGITDEKGKLLSSVHFHGVMGEEKKDLIAATSVGVANPSGRTETFGISAIDFSSRGIPVVTIASGGFLDTVIHEETGLLYSNPEDLSHCIVRLLKDTDLNERCGLNGMKFAAKFAPDLLIGKWKALFDLVLQGKYPSLKMPSDYTHNNLKQYRIFNRKIKQRLHCEYPISIIAIETLGRNFLRMLGR